MARRHALPRPFGHIHPRYRTPDVSTWWVAGIAIAWYVIVSLVSENALFDSLTALSLLIAFYYALTGLACAWYFRHRLRERTATLLFAGVAPVLGAVMLLWLLVESVIDMSDPENSYTGQSWLGVGPPLVIGVVIFVAGIALMLWWRTRSPDYWEETPSTAEEVNLTR
jgi:amino acid transporter